MYGYIIFTDIEKYSTLKDADLKIFFNQIAPEIFEELKFYRESAIIWNTWGDAIFAIYDKAENAINMALAYREAFNKTDFEKYGIRKLNPRIAGNFGEFEIGYDHVSGKKNVHGTLVNITARIEPVTTPGEIFVTKEFKDMSLSSYDKVANVRFEDMGEIKLPKNAGALNLFRLCKREEKSIPAAGKLLNPMFDYNIQAPINFSQQKEPVIKLPEKSIEQRLSLNLTPKEPSPVKSDKIDKIASTFKDENYKNKKEKMGSKPSKPIKIKTPKEIIKDNPFMIAMIIFVISTLLNIGIRTIMPSIMLSLPFSPDIKAHITNWIWLLGYLTGSFITGQFITHLHRKIIKIESILITPIIAVGLHLILYIIPNKTSVASVFFMQNMLINILILWLVAVAGFFKGVETANDIIKSKK